MEVPDNVFDDRHAFEAFLARMGGDPRRDGEELIAYLQGWLERNEACATGQRREDAQRLIRELTSIVPFEQAGAAAHPILSLLEPSGSARCT